MEVYRAKDLNFTYAGCEKPALQHIDFSVNEGDFVLLFGASGSGKTTLLRLLKQEIAPAGHLSGELTYLGTSVRDVPYKTSVAEIGYTAQNPDTQQVSEFVCNELRFLLENLGVSEAEINLRVAETVTFFGTEDLYSRRISTLSGGEKQIVNLQAVFVSNPRVLLLDEPLSQLDPFSCGRFVELLGRISRELGVTVFVAEHNIQPILPLVTKVLYLENGACTAFESADRFLEAQPSASPVTAIPAALGIPVTAPVPKTVPACRELLKTLPSLPTPALKTETEKQEVALRLSDVSFRYGRDEKDVLNGVSLDLRRGEIFSVVGANGSGKTTLLKVLSGVCKPYAGKRKASDTLRVANVPQNPQACFSFDTVLEVLQFAANPPAPKALFHALNSKTPAENIKPLESVKSVVEKLGLSDVLLSNPFDLSSGQQQRVAIARALLQSPDVLLFDEATKGLDSDRKKTLARLLNDLKGQGKAILLVTHDLDFAAEVSDRCALLFDGKLALTADNRAFFTESTVYTSTVARAFSFAPAEARPVSMREVQNGEI